MAFKHIFSNFRQSVYLNGNWRPVTRLVEILPVMNNLFWLLVGWWILTRVVSSLHLHCGC